MERPPVAKLEKALLINSTVGFRADYHLVNLEKQEKLVNLSKLVQLVKIMKVGSSWWLLVVPRGS